MIIVIRQFIYTDGFNTKWEKLKLTDDDLLALELYLLKNLHSGKVIQGTGGLRKLRWKLPNTGKSGGLRILYVDIVICEELFMIDLFAKSEKDNLTEADKNTIKQFIATRIKKGKGR